MNDLEYLHQISATNRSAGRGGGLGMSGGSLADKLRRLMKTKIFKFSAIGVALILVFSMATSVLGQFSGREKDSLIRLQLRMTNLSTSVTKYNAFVKSSRLRAMGVTFSGILSETSRDVFNLLTTEYDYDASKVPGDIAKEETKHAEEMNSALEQAKLNGILDRVYLHQLVYEVSLLSTLEAEAMSRTDDASVEQILGNSMESLEVLYGQLSTYSDSTS